MSPSLRLERILLDVRASGAKVCMLGIGNELLGDDGAGSRLARELAALRLPGLRAIPAGIAPENAYGLVKASGAGTLILVDAVALVDRPRGAWDFFDPETLDAAIHSTHSVPLSLFVRMWKEDLPGLDVHFLGINLCEAPGLEAMSRDMEAVLAELRDAFRGAFEPARA